MSDNKDAAPKPQSKEPVKVEPQAPIVMPGTKADPLAEFPVAGFGAKLYRFATAYNHFMFEVADWLIVLCAVVVCAALIAQITEKTLTVGIAIIAICTGLSSACFGYARALDSKGELRDRVIFAGERLLHGAVIAVLAAVVKIIGNNADKVVWAQWMKYVKIGIEISAGSASLALFIAALFYAITGLRVLNRSLRKVADSHPEWIDG